VQQQNLIAVGVEVSAVSSRFVSEDQDFRVQVETVSARHANDLAVDVKVSH
jgi:hypothetical protein